MRGSVGRRCWFGQEPRSTGTAGCPRAPGRGPTSQPQKKKHRSPGERRPWGFISPLTSLGRGTSDKNQASACSAWTAAGSGTVRTKGKRHGNCMDSPAPKVRTRGVLLLCSLFLSSTPPARTWRHLCCSTAPGSPPAGAGDRPRLFLVSSPSPAGARSVWGGCVRLGFGTPFLVNRLKWTEGGSCSASVWGVCVGLWGGLFLFRFFPIWYKTKLLCMFASCTAF